MVKAKAAAADVRIPQNRDEAAAMIAEYGAAAIEVLRIEAELKQTLAKEKKAAEDLAAPFMKKAEDIYKGLHTYCAANREQLLGNSGTKTVDFGTGTVRWRYNPPKVKISGGEEAVIDLINQKRVEAIEKKDTSTAAAFDNFLRVKVEIDREAMLKNPDLARAIAGVSIPKGGEMFEVEPFGAELSESAA
ncbi:host-nuclease inhibitor Gam family protein [Bradyrhizobium sp. BR 10289]|uniref:host-nuclease inhibitor Gam family protein n=1 Tax=Bradyrhizobium sp. BR 10289 TaxID=2749993 RepID=UPI001C65041C|nr:host-nuclease inhibitor Gam family protein [Bradyrhizobium sp. BR 10289]MBW7968151.1 host-nuclease inhibitor Gam family protein [Bradyrhizobium sp. BR 10289]